MASEVDRKRSCYLSVDAYTRLELVMTGLAPALGARPYLVGSCLTRPDYRDVDIRVPIEDAHHPVSDVAVPRLGNRPAHRLSVADTHRVQDA
jgi:hypothetical protein